MKALKEGIVWVIMTALVTYGSFVVFNALIAWFE